MSATEVANTPSSFAEVASADALRQLEFSAALDAVARHAVSDLGANSVRARLPSRSLDWIQAELAAVAEFQRLIGDGDDFRPEPIADIAALIETLEIAGSVLEPEGLNLVGATLSAMHTVRQGLVRIGEQAPLVSALATEIPPIGLAQNIARALEPDGTVRDGASTQLATARRRLRDTRSRLRSLLEKALRDAGSDAQGEVTVRSGRYVIPLRRDSRSGIKGIVHGESGSGSTLFVEPAVAVELGNELNGWEAEEARAVLAVLRDLTETLRPYSGLLRAGVEMCVAVDDLCARAMYVIEVAGAVPVLPADEPGFRVVDGRHPLLFVDSESPVPFSLEFSKGQHTIVVSGPNAGGKTVLLKGVGLLCTLTQAGVAPPVGRDTTLPIFDRIFVDIGDHQSIAESLSTFSAHMAATKDILSRADSRSLVLLDELGGGTDPTEGSALAGAVLQSLNDRCSFTIATTHLSGLKELAARTPGMANASFHFDVETLAPTYRFVQDRPGRSYGLAIAARLGLPDDVLARADSLLPEAARSLDSVLADLEVREESLAEKEAAAAQEIARLAAERIAATELADRLNRREQEVADREREVEREGRQQARQFMLNARQRVEEALSIARKPVTEATAKQARRLVEEGVQEEGDALKRLEAKAKALGWRVKGSQPEPAEHVSHAPLPSTTAFELATHSVVSDLDLRGRNGDDAEAELLIALDAAVAADLPWLRIIHGKGTGALRARVAEVLGLDSRVRCFQLAPPTQGGSGVTIAEFYR